MVQPPNPGPIENVRQGMRVIDATGNEIGTVQLVKMGDPSAATVGADADPNAKFVGDIPVAPAGDEPQLPPTLRARYMRVGFVMIDGPGLTDTDRYVLADRIAGVSGDTVRLSVPKSRLAEEVT